jgi:hypothetical protein
MFGALWDRATHLISYNSPLGGLEGVEQELFWEEFKHPSSLLGQIGGLGNVVIA